MRHVRLAHGTHINVFADELEVIAGQYLGAPPPLSPQQHQIHNAEPSRPPRRWRPNYYDDMIAGQAPTHSKFNGNSERLEGWHLQVTAYFTITRTRYEHERFAFVGLRMDAKALAW